MYRRELDLEDEEHSSAVGTDHGDDDFDCGQEAYQNEPLADEAWLENYERETEEKRRHL